jgi:hypothetical protein
MKYALSLIASLALVSLLGAFTTAPAMAAPARDYAAAVDGGELPPCPSMFRCRVR